MNPTAVFSKSGKGVQEASGKTSHLSRADRAVLSAFDGRMTVNEVAEKVGKPFDPKFEQLVEQLEKDGFVRQVSAGVSPVAPPPRAAAPGHKPAGSAGPAEELDFTIFAAPKPAAPKAAAPKPAAPAVDLAAKAREEAERKAKEEQATSYKARQEIERARQEAETRAKAAAQARLQAEAAAKAKAEAEAQAKSEAEAAARAKAADAEAKVRAEADAKVKAAREAAVRAAADAKAKAEAELNARLEAERAKAREEAERIRREADEKARREAEELRQRLEEERKAREEAERVRREAEEKARREAEEKARREAEELRQRLEEERQAREKAEAARKKAEEQARAEAERARKEAEDRARREAEEKARREADEKAARRKAEEEREARERAERERAQREEEERAEKQRAERERAERERMEKEKQQAAPAATGSFSDSLLADLDSFGKRDDEELKAREQADASRRRAEQQAREDAERKSREDAERREREDAQRRSREQAERKAREEAERKAAAEAEEARQRDAEDRKRQARDALAAKAAETESDDIGVTDEDLDLEDVKRDQKALTKEARRAAREREKESDRDRRRGREPEPAVAEAEVEAPAAPVRIRRPMKWGKPVTVGLFLLLAAAIAGVHVMPISTADYEKAASEALGVPVKIGSARVSLFTGVQLKLDKVTAGASRIGAVRAFPTIGSLLGEKKSFSRMELEDVTVPQDAIRAALFAKVKGANFEVGRLLARKVKLDGPLVFPIFDADAVLAADGSVSAVGVRGEDSLMGKLTPQGSEVEFEINAGTFALPVAPEIAFNQFGMKGVAAASNMDISSWSATLYDGVISGTARFSWGASYSLDGVATVRGMNVAVFAPALVSEGKVEGTGRFSMSGTDASKLGAAARLEGNFTISKGVLGSIDISRAISTGGRQASGRTPFAELVGQGVYDRGAVQLRNITIGAGALNAGASADIAQGGALSGRIVADVRTATQTLRATLNLGGTVKEPQVKN